MVMTFSSALALFVVMPKHQRDSVVRVFDGIRAAFDNVEDAFIQAVSDEAIVIEREMLLLEACMPGANAVSARRRGFGKK
jgi:hypothetical protein